MNFANITSWTIPEGSVTQVTDSNGDIIWSQNSHDYSRDYFYIEDASGSDNTITIKKVNQTSGGDAPTILVYYSTNQTSWSSLGNITTAGKTVTVPANGKIYFRVTTRGWCDPDYPDTFLNYIRSTSNYRVGGNIMSLLNGSNFYGSDFSNSNNNCLHNIFSGSLIDASNLVLPATTLIKGCYSQLFYYTNLVNPPAILPATTLADGCYSGMFSGCASLTTAPALPATTLADGCYSAMFRYCRALTTAPALPATTLAQYCYNMMFTGCTALTTAPALPATSLSENCYAYMFQNCSSLNNITTYANTITATDCLKNWMDGVAAQGDFWNLGSATYESSVSGIPSGWTEHTSL